MKGFILLSLLCVVVTSKRFVEPHWIESNDPDEDFGDHLVLVKYKTRKMVTGIETLMACLHNRPDCNTVYRDAISHKTFKQILDATLWLTSQNKTQQDIFGVYVLQPLRISHRMSKQMVVRDVQMKVEVPVNSWYMADDEI